MSNKITTKQIVHGASSLADVLDAKVGVSVDFSTTWDPPAISAGSYTTQVFAVTGATLNDFVHISHSQPLAGCILSGQVTAADQVTAHIFNPTGSTVNIAGGTLKVRLTRSA